MRGYVTSQSRDICARVRTPPCRPTPPYLESEPCCILGRQSPATSVRQDPRAGREAGTNLEQEAWDAVAIAVSVQEWRSAWQRELAIRIDVVEALTAVALIKKTGSPLAVAEDTFALDVVKHISGGEHCVECFLGSHPLKVRSEVAGASSTPLLRSSRRRKISSLSLSRAQHEVIADERVRKAQLDLSAAEVECRRRSNAGRHHGDAFLRRAPQARSTSGSDARLTCVGHACPHRNPSNGSSGSSKPTLQQTDMK